MLTTIPENWSKETVDELFRIEGLESLSCRVRCGQDKIEIGACTCQCINDRKVQEGSSAHVHFLDSMKCGSKGDYRMLSEAKESDCTHLVKFRNGSNKYMAREEELPCIIVSGNSRGIYKVIAFGAFIFPARRGIFYVKESRLKPISHE